jgi:hypothetical protein
MCPTVVATSMERFKNFTVGELNAALAGFAPLLKVHRCAY